MQVLVYDATSQESFHALRQWLELIKQKNNGRNLPGVVIANKMDMEHRIAVNPQDGAQFAQSLGFEFFEVSAAKNQNIEETFKAVAQMYYGKYEERIQGL